MKDAMALIVLFAVMNLLLIAERCRARLWISASRYLLQGSICPVGGLRVRRHWCDLLLKAIRSPARPVVRDRIEGTRTKGQARIAHG